MKKLVSIVLALVMILVVGMASAGKLTITPPENIDANAKNTYTCYQIFTGTTNGTAISYKLPDGVTAAPSGFAVDTAGNVSLVRTTGDLTKLTDDEISGIKSYIETNKTKLAKKEVTVTGREVAEFDGLDVGYYFIDTTVGTLVSIDSVKADISLNDKNSVPTLTKEITAASGSITDKNGNIINPAQVDELGKHAISQIGTYVNFESKIVVGKGMKDYVFHDTMNTGLELDTTSISVSYSAKPENYVEATPVTAKSEGKDTITINFNNGLAENTVITIQYRAKVTNDALTVVPEKNTAYVEYSNGPRTGKTPEEKTETYSAKIGVLKLDATDPDNKKPLKDAGFKLYKFDTDGTTKLYYSYDSTTKSVTWAATSTDERMTGTDGKISPFIGLNDGTYYLEETTVPDGFNAPLADTQVVITGNDYTAANLEQEKTIENKQGTVLPSTGGIGTTIFYILGGLLVIGAAVILVARRKAQD